MGYSQRHKVETHAKLVKLAGRVLREKGPEKVAVVDLMHSVRPDTRRLLRPFQIQGGASC